MNKKIFSCLKKRDYLNAKVFDREECVRYGEWFKSQGFLSDAIDFFAKAEAKEKLEELIPQIISEGDVFLFKKIYQALKEKPPKEVWEKIGENALKLGKMNFALKAFQEIDNKEKIKEIEETMQAQGLYIASQLSLPFLKPENKKLKKKK
ncbi:MAG TPA: hypothetical protein ENG63_11435 [Candidatus Desulfofervidus auxilii]|uniref:Uncharacterized protein n=1 Tax=Desulfofervidus auxilii TaxID=1621989 RepID=A0A7C0Y727_DESA2|nr:hypothetical protein [Candidatus Desulfofervidus auxilii]